MSDKKKHRDSASKKALPVDEAGVVVVAPGKSSKVSNDEIRAIRDSIEQMRLQMEHLTRVCSQVAAKQASLQKSVMAHLSYETQRDDQLLQQEIDDVTCCGFSFARIV